MNYFSDKNAMSRLTVCFMWMFLAVAALMVFHIDPALAQSDPWGKPTEKALDVFKNVKNIVLILGGIGVLVLAVMAFFGKFKWLWMVSLIGGLVMVLIVGEFIGYFSGDSAIASQIETNQ